MTQIGRPPTGAYVTIQHLDTGQIVSWSDGALTGDPELVAATRQVLDAHQGRTVTVGPDNLPVNPVTARGVAAAALYACTGRGMIRSASFAGPLGEPEPGAATGVTR